MPFIDFSEYSRNAFDDVENKRLSQFNQSCVIAGILTAETQQAQDYLDMFIDTLSGRTITRGKGVQLDALGRIVGQDRQLLFEGSKKWLRPDPQNPPNTFPDGPPDTSYAWVDGVNIEINNIANDNQYRNIIKSKIIKNQVKYGSVEELQKWTKQRYGLEISVEIVGPLTIDLIVPVGTPTYIKDALAYTYANSLSDKIYYAPIPVGTSINQIKELGS